MYNIDKGRETWIKSHVLESMRLSYRLDELILKKVLIDLRKRLDAGFSIQPVSVNL